MEKRGVSVVVGIVLLLVVSIAGVVILFTVVKFFLNTNLSAEELKVQLSVDKVSLSPEGSAQVYVGRSPGGADIAGYKLVFTDPAGESQMRSISGNLKPLERKIVTVSDLPQGFTVSSVQAFPFFIDEQGRETVSRIGSDMKGFGTSSGSGGGGGGNPGGGGDAVNGVCGSSNGQSVPSAPSINLCSVGTASAVSGAGPWMWGCVGSNGGTTAQCSANPLGSNPSTIDGICGSSNAQVSTSKPTINLCSVGTASAVIGSGPWSWACLGSGGGGSVSCATLPSDIVCDYGLVACNGVCKLPEECDGCPDNKIMCNNYCSLPENCPTCPPETPIRCLTTGSCVSSQSQCPTCRDDQQLCSDGTCKADCGYPNGPCLVEGQTRCPDGQCRYSCAVCPLGERMCADGTCKVSCGPDPCNTDVWGSWGSGDNTLCKYNPWLTAYWPMDDLGGMKEDIVGNNDLSGTAVYSKGFEVNGIVKGKKSAKFMNTADNVNFETGTGRYLRTVLTSDLKPGANLVVAMWVKRVVSIQDPFGIAPLFSAESSNGAYNYRMFIKANGGDERAWIIPTSSLRQASDGEYHTDNPWNGIFPDAWACVYFMAHNGQLNFDSRPYDGTIKQSDGTFYIGRAFEVDQSRMYDFFKGEIDEVAVWKDIPNELAAGEIGNTFCSGYKYRL